jgi:hypothetical protein
MVAMPQLIPAVAVEALANKAAQSLVVMGLLELLLFPMQVHNNLLVAQSLLQALAILSTHLLVLER